MTDGRRERVPVGEYIEIKEKLKKAGYETPLERARRRSRPARGLPRIPRPVRNASRIPVPSYDQIFESYEGPRHNLGEKR